MTLYEAINSAREKKPVVYNCKLYERIGSIYMTFYDNETVIALMEKGKIAMIVKDVHEIYDFVEFKADVEKMLEDKKNE